MKFPQSVSVAAVCWISSPRGGAAWCRLFSLLISITTSRLLSASERAEQREGGCWLLVADLSIRSITGPKASLAIITPRAPPIIGARKAASCMMIHWQTSHRGTPALVNEAIFSCVPCKSAAAPDWVRGNGSRRNNPASCHATAGPLQLQSGVLSAVCMTSLYHQSPASRGS